MTTEAHCDFAGAREILEIERRDLLETLNGNRSRFINVAHRTLLRDRLQVLQLTEDELRESEAELAGHNFQSPMFQSTSAVNHAVAEEDDDDLEDIESMSSATLVNGMQAQQPRVQITQQPHYAAPGVRSAPEDELAAKSTVTNGKGKGKAEESESASGNVVGSVINNIGEQLEVSPHIECNICADTCHACQVVQLPCHHTWCRVCICTQFEEATANEDAWPPKCCRQSISVDAVSLLLHPELRTRFDMKSLEYSTSNRTYCHKASCAAFILPNTIHERRAVCERSHETCVECKGLHHEQPLCPNGSAEDDRMLEELARNNGWPRCLNCRRFVEINEGCNHMTCRCGTQFCYMCSVAWKTDERGVKNSCSCSVNGFDRPMRNARRAAERQGRIDIGQVARELGDRQDCAHLRYWNKIGGGRCDECTDNMEWLLECPSCRLAACRQCKSSRFRNRA